MKRTNKRLRRITFALMAMLVIAAVTAGSVLAYLRTQTGGVENSFGIENETDPTITESFNNTLKENVKVNVGNLNYSVYVRAAIVITWKNKVDGDVLGQPPVKDTDYEIILNESDWFEYGGYYYCKEPVIEGDETAILIESVSLADGVTAPEGYGLNVEIIAQTIQAAGKTDVGDIPAVTDAWGVTVDADKHLVDPTP